MTLVLDASTAVHALLATPLRAPTRAHLRGHDLVAPSLIDTEVLSALARLERAGQITADEAGAAVAAWRDLPCERVPSSALIEQVWSLRHAIRVADAHYVAVAQAYGVPLLTADARLARARIGGVSVLLVS
ncbi:type II toxin-antitoxin system VapC family toxin [Cellulomonas sp. JH27-2]|uniref:type II toxin-antitoxin system VapC family toxin n=1 Tax=Cellulomonas sp. JH27-2 TaxID=2774139 RepID=UPI00177B4CB2|nr:type II toxin-antitoxin system VapC family toxin [Cellulomonas sp. JH27-2]